MDVKLENNNSELIKNELLEKVAIALEMVGAQVEGYAKLNCPVDTGLLRNSITHAQVDEHTEAIGTNVEYAAYVELGTSRQSAQPYLEPAVMDHISEYNSIIQECLKNE